MPLQSHPKLKWAIKLVLSLAILVACFFYVDVNKFGTSVTDVRSGYLILALFLNIIGSIVIPVLITHKSLQTKKLSIPLRDLLKINFTVRFYTLIFPRGVATGIRWHKYKKGGSGPDAIALVIFEKIFQVLILALTAAIFLAIDRSILPGNSNAIFTAALLVVFFSVVCVLPFLSVSFSGLFSRLLKKIETFIPQPVYVRIMNVWEAVSAFQKLERRTIFYITGLSIASYIFFILSAYVLSFAMAINISLYGIAWIRSLVLLLALIPVTVAGLGVREASYIFFMGMYGIPSYESLGFAIVLFTIQLAIGAIGACIEVWDHYIKVLFVKKEQAG